MSQRTDSDTHVTIFPLIEYKGGKFPSFPGFKKDIETHLLRIRQFKSRKTDILLCTFPRSGYHWAHEIICMLLNNTTEYNSRITETKYNLDIQTSPECLEAEPDPRLLHTNLPFTFLPAAHIEKKAKIVFVSRNPKDRHVSLYNFLKVKTGAPQNWTWSKYFDENVIHDNIATGWFNYTREMIDALQDKSNNIHLVLYEDMKSKPKNEIEQLADFLEVDYDETFLNAIAERCLFDKLKKHLIDDTAELDPENKSSLFRKGQIGDWKNWFTVEQNEQFDALYKHEMDGVDIKFTYDTIVEK